MAVLGGVSEFRWCNEMATLPEIGAKATNGSNAIPEAGPSWPSWPRASEGADASASGRAIPKVPEAAALEATHGQIDGSFSKLPFNCHLGEVASVGD